MEHRQIGQDKYMVFISVYYLTIYDTITNKMDNIFPSVALWPNANHGLILEVFRSHTTTHHSP
jgi:hypothetical protein